MEERKGRVIFPIPMKLDFEGILEVLEVPVLKFTWIMAWIVGGGSIGNGFFIDIDNLYTFSKSVMNESYLTYPPLFQRGRIRPF